MKKNEVLGWLLVGWTVIPGLIACAMVVKNRDNLNALQNTVDGVLEVLHDEDIIQLKK